MGLFSGIGKAFGFGSAKSFDTTPSSWLVQAMGGGPTASGVTVNPTSALQSTVVLACTRVLSEDLAKLPLSIYRKKKGGGREEATDHPLWKLLNRRPNDYQSSFQFKEMMQTALVLRGNAYAYIKRDYRGRPTALIPVFPDRVNVFETPGGDIFYNVARRGLHEAAELERAPLLVPSYDMLHIAFMTLDGIRGMSVIQVAREAIGLGLSQEAYAAHLAGNGARPGGVLQAKGKLSADAIARLRSSWDGAHGGVANSGKTAVLEDGLEWHPISMNANDAQFLEQRQYQTTEISRIFRVPPHKINDLTRSTNNNIEHQSLEYYSDTLMPWLYRWEEALNWQLLDESEDDLFFDFDVRQMLRGDQASRVAYYQSARNWGWLSVNEVREMEGFNPVEGGDQLLQPLNMVPLGQQPEPQPDVLTPEQAKSVVHKAILSRRIRDVGQP